MYGSLSPYNVALKPDEVHLHLEGGTTGRVVGLDVVQQVSEELVTSLQDTESNERVTKVVADVLG